MMQLAKRKTGSKLSKSSKTHKRRQIKKLVRTEKRLIKRPKQSKQQTKIRPSKRKNKLRKLQRKRPKRQSSTPMQKLKQTRTLKKIKRRWTSKLRLRRQRKMLS